MAGASYGDVSSGCGGAGSGCGRAVRASDRRVCGAAATKLHQAQKGEEPCPHQYLPSRSFPAHASPFSPLLSRTRNILFPLTSRRHTTTFLHVQTLRKNNENFPVINAIITVDVWSSHAPRRQVSVVQHAPPAGSTRLTLAVADAGRTALKGGGISLFQYDAELVEFQLIQVCSYPFVFLHD